MFIKICYGPLHSVTFLDVSAVDFVSHLQSKVYYNKESITCHHDSDGRAIDFTPCIHEEYLKDNVGCSSKGATDSEFYLNTLDITRKDGSLISVAYTGTAYLCNDQGKTVDTFR